MSIEKKAMLWDGAGLASACFVGFVVLCTYCRRPDDTFVAETVFGKQGQEGWARRGEVWCARNRRGATAGSHKLRRKGEKVRDV